MWKKRWREKRNPPGGKRENDGRRGAVSSRDGGGARVAAPSRRPWPRRPSTSASSACDGANCPDCCPGCRAVSCAGYRWKYSRNTIVSQWFCSTFLSSWLKSISIPFFLKEAYSGISIPFQSLKLVNLISIL